MAGDAVLFLEQRQSRFRLFTGRLDIGGVGAGGPDIDGINRENGAKAEEQAAF